MKSLAVLAFALMGLSAHSEVLFTEVFDGAGAPLNGKLATSGAGVWSANSIVTDNGVLTASQGSALLPFAPTTNRIYTASIDFNYSSGSGGWFGLGFSSVSAVSGPGTSVQNDRFSNANVPGYSWMIVGNTTVSGVFKGSRTAGPIAYLTPSLAPGFHTLKIILNTVGDDSSFTADFLVDGSSVISGGPTNITLALSTLKSVGFTQYGSLLTGSTVDNFSLTEVGLTPWSPSPANAAVGVATNVVFQWSKARDPLNIAVADPRIVSNTVHYIAYDLNSVVPAGPDFQNALAVTVRLAASADPAGYPATGAIAFGNNQRVFWQVEHNLNTGGTIPGPVWSFDTLQTGQLDIMQYWAPVVYQDFQTGIDYGKQLYGAKDAIVALNFDGNWTMANNWSNSIYQVDQQGVSDAPLKGKVYASFIESAGFYFIKYGFYHAGQDSGDYGTSNARHQNDWEVLVMAIRKDGTDHGSLAALVTQAHTGVNLYTSSQLQFSQHRPIIYIEPNGLLAGHGISAYSSQSPGPDGVVYMPDSYSENVVSCNLTSSGDWATAPNFRYKLVPLAEIWCMRGYSSVFASTKLLQYDPAGEVAGGYLTWDKVYFYDPIDYFKTNFVSLATDLASDQYVFHPYNGYDSSQIGPANPMGIFPASEWLTSVVSGGFGQAWTYRSGCTLYRKDATGSGDAAYTYRAISGDLEISARVDSVQDVANHEAGLMIRESLSTNATFIYLSVSPDQQVHVSYRNSTGGAITVGPVGAVPADDRPVWIQLERRAGVFKASYSYAAEPSYSTLLETTLSTNANLVCGLAAASTATATWAASSFSDLAVSQLAAEPAVLLGVNHSGSTSFTLLFTGTEGTQYILQEATTLANGWTDVGVSVTCVPGTNSLVRSSSAPATFWRIRKFP